MTNQLDVPSSAWALTYRPPAEDHRSCDLQREAYSTLTQINKLLYGAIDGLELALDHVQQAQDIAISDLEKPETKIKFAIQELWTAIYTEQDNH